MNNPHFRYSKDTYLEGQYSPDYPWFSRVYHHYYHIPYGSKVLDVGCNSGGLATLLTGRNCEFYGVDIAHHMLLKAISKDKGYQAVQAYGEYLPFSNNIFDVVVLSEVLEHADSPGLMASEAVRVLKPGGKILGDVPTPYGKWGYRSLRKHKWHRRVFNKWSIRPLFPFPIHISVAPKWSTIVSRKSTFFLPQWHTFVGIKSV